VKRRFLSRTTSGAAVLAIALAVLSAISLTPVQGSVLEPITPVQPQGSSANALVADVLALPTSSSPAAPGPRTEALDPAGIQRLLEATGNTAKVSLNPATGAVRFVRLEPGRLALKTATGPSAEAQAVAFFNEYGSIFGIRDASRELALLERRTDRFGTSHLTYRQVYQGVPIFAGLVRVHFDRAGQLSAVNGVFLPDLALDATPSLSTEQAAARAIAEVVAQPYSDATHASAEKVAADSLTVKRTQLYVYRAGLAQGIAGLNHLVYEVEVTKGTTLREFLYISAISGKLVDRMSGIHNALSRRLSEQDPANVVWTEGDPFPGSLNLDQAGILTATEDSYYLFLHAFGYASYDGADAVMHSVNNDPTIDCPNANWNGETTNYCNGVTGDDTVAHEWGHAYTEYTHNLVYAWQPGALNESYSDIWGETVDELNSYGTDTPNIVRTVGACSSLTTNQGTPTLENSIRWLSGEDDPAFGGAIRDLWNPTCKGDPGKVSDTQYHCATSDSGGVHTNSGVPNHGFTLLVDGGTFNGQTITAIGLTKAAHIYWRAQSVYQTPTSDFVDHADALAQSCTDLIGTNLPALTTSSVSGGLSGQMITTADCTEVADMALAVELRTEPTQCNFQPLLNPAAPGDLCVGATGPSQTAYLDAFTSLNNWSLSNSGVYTGFIPFNWVVTSTLPGGRVGSAAFGIDPNLGSCDAGDDDISGHWLMTSQVITVPTGNITPRLSFDHYVATEAQYDGGNIKISINGGAFSVIPSTAFLYNAYNTTFAAAPGNTNPLAGQPAFSGTNGGTLRGSWGTSLIDLAALGVQPGNTIRVQYDMGVDGCTGFDGWYVDDFQLYTCSNARPTIQVPVAAAGGISATLMTSASLPVTVPFAINNTGDADLIWNIVEAPASKTPLATDLVKQRATGPRASSPAAPTAPTSNVIQDPSFEATAANQTNPYWEEFSELFGSPLCDANCGADIARTGSWFVWFGGVPQAESGYVRQNVTIPAGYDNLSFWLIMGRPAGGTGTGHLAVSMDGAEIFRVTEANLAAYADYTLVSLDISAYADGASHLLSIDSATQNGTLNFFVDDVAIDNISCATPTNVPWLTVSPTNGTVTPSSTNNVNVTMNPTGLADGTYTAHVCINNNSAMTPVVVPVMMVVGAPTAITIATLAGNTASWPLVGLLPVGLVLLGLVVAVRRRRA
jgi:bacillolysin